MEEVTLSPPYFHNFCLSLINSGVCLLFNDGSTADVSPEICQSMHENYFHASFSWKQFGVTCPAS